MPESEAKRITFICELDGHELAVRMFEAMYSVKRPDGLTSTQALERLGEEAGRDFMLCAIAAMHYFKEKMEEPDTRTLQ